MTYNFPYTSHRRIILGIFFSPLNYVFITQSVIIYKCILHIRTISVCSIMKKKTYMFPKMKILLTKGTPKILGIKLFV